MRGAEGYYDPFLFAQLSKRSADTKGTNVFSGGARDQRPKLDIWNFGVDQAIPTGGDLSVAFNNNKRDTNNVFSTFNPVFGSGLAFNLTQPLLQEPQDRRRRARTQAGARRTARSRTSSSARRSSTPSRS